MRSILGSGGKDPKTQMNQLAESSFNQSFHVSTDKAFSQIGSPLHAPQTQFFSPRIPQNQQIRGPGQPPSAFLKSPERHEDSLFESSKASANQHNSRRQFMGGVKGFTHQQ